MEERNYWLGFSLFSGIGPKRFAQLLDYFKTAKQAWEANNHELRKAGLGEKTTAHFLDFRKQFSFEKYAEQLKQKEIEFVTLADKNYPTLLKQAGSSNPHPSPLPSREREQEAAPNSSPFLLYCKGNISLLNQLPTIGIVGTRKITSYGQQVTQIFTQELVNSGFVIVSGLAMGVDACSHQMTIDNHGKTIAVLGCGVDCCYPSSNQILYDAILQHDGLIVSEFPVSMQPSIGSFPSRNRIIAGLSQAVLVTEGAEDSGALITAKDAFDLSRPVFAIPGQITSQLAKGPLKLLQKGAKLVISPDDIRRELRIMNNELSTNEKKIKKEMKGENEEEQAVIDFLQNESLPFDEIVRRTRIDASKVGTLLSMMELKGMIMIGEGGEYRLLNC